MTIGIMIDIESLSLGPHPVITQLGLQAWNLADASEYIGTPLHTYLPIDPQISSLIPSRKVSGDTLIWWMEQSDAARMAFKESRGNDVDELFSLMRHFVRRFNTITNEGTADYEIWARGPQFDLVAIESLLFQCGIPAPWAYDKVNDLRTLMHLANLKTKDVPMPTGLVRHNALDDCRYQILCYEAAIRALYPRA
jgi:3' exoribonuclease, RNase T-like